MGFTPVVLSFAVLAVLVGVIWVLSKLSIFPNSNLQSDLCGYVITEDLTLDQDIFCPANSLGQLPREATMSFVFFTEGSDVTLDCRGHSIISEGGTGLIVEHGKNITLKNCRFEGLDFTVRAVESANLQILDSTASVKIGGVMIANGEHSIIRGNAIRGSAEKAKWGIEIIGGRDSTIEKNILSNFALSGINFYSSQDFKVVNNEIQNIGDTGIGIFSKDDRPVSSNGLISENLIEHVQNVGAIEIMHSSSDLRITKNKIDNAHSAMYIYKPLPDSPIKDITFSQNHIKRVFWPFTLIDCQDVRIEGNFVAQSSGGGLFSIKDVSGIRITKNSFELNKGGLIIQKNTEDVQFTDNSFVSHFGSFLRMGEKPENYDFSRNYWDGCPQPSRFEGIDFPKDLNPVIREKGNTDYYNVQISNDSKNGQSVCIDKVKISSK